MAEHLNTWLPGGNTYTFPNTNPGVTLSMAQAAFGGTQILVQRAVITNDSSGFGITFDMINPPFTMTKPPKILYQSDKDAQLVVKDADGWNWTAPMRAQPTMAERGWSWEKFQLHDVQDNTGEQPTTPTPGVIRAYQFQAAQGVTYPLTLNIAYLVAQSPVSATSSDIRKAQITVTDPGALTFKVGDVQLVGGQRRPVRYYGSAPFGLQMNGPSRNGRTVTPYRGPYIAGYQSGTPWVQLGTTASLDAMLDFMAESQLQFSQRHPQNLLGPFMHCYLPAVWDSEQNGTLDTWVWDAPDGNPAWSGWQYRAFDAMAATWKAAVDKGMTSASKAATVCNRFLSWIAGWLEQNPAANYIPSDWRPPGWVQGQPLPPNSYLDPHGTTPEPHDIALVLKAAIHCALAGADQARCRAVIRRCIQALKAVQVTTSGDPMRGCFTTNPAGFVAYGFQQGEILHALALARANPSLLAS